MAYQIPDSRKIILEPNSPAFGSTEKSWKNILPVLLSSKQGSAFGELFKNGLTVHDKVDLTFDKDSPNLKFKVPLNTPLLNFVNEKLGTAFTVASLATSAVSSAVDAISKGQAANYEPSSSFVPWTLGVPTWDNTKAEGIEFDYTFEFALGQFGLWNAEEEVVKPLLNLTAPALIRELNSWTAAGPYPAGPDLLVKTILRLVNDAGAGTAAGGGGFAGFTSWLSKQFTDNGNFSLQKIGEALESLMLSVFTDYTYNISFGKILRFSKMLITQSNLQLSNQVDEAGFPIKGSATLTFKGLIPAALTTGSNAGRQAVRFGGV